MVDPVKRPVRIAICGSARLSPGGTLGDAAEEIGRRLAEAGAIVVCGGLGGVMEAAARGAAAAGGLTVGILPGTDPGTANPYIGVPLATGLGEARNALVVRAADAVIAVGGEWGTLSEVALARKMGKGVVVFRPGLTASLGLDEARSPEGAVSQALALARGVA